MSQAKRLVPVLLVLSCVLGISIAVAETECINADGSECLVDPAAVSPQTVQDLASSAFEVGTELPVPGLNCTIFASDQIISPGAVDVGYVGVLTFLCSFDDKKKDPKKCESTETTSRSSTKDCGGTAKGPCQVAAQAKCYEKLEGDEDIGCVHDAGPCVYGPKELKGRCILTNSVRASVESYDMKENEATSKCWYRCAYKCQKYIKPKEKEEELQTPEDTDTPAPTAAPVPSVPSATPAATPAPTTAPTAAPTVAPTGAPVAAPSYSATMMLR